jgi:hypothetical protein
MTQEEQYYFKLLMSLYPCKVSFSVGVKNDKPKKRLGSYYPRQKRIIIHTGERDKYDPVETAIHEYAHHLHYTEFNMEKKKQAPHGKEFWQIYGQLLYRAKVLGIYDSKQEVVLDFPPQNNNTSIKGFFREFLDWFFGD